MRRRRRKWCCGCSGDQTATLCYAGRDDDPWTKLIFGIDDVLDTSVILFPGDLATRTMPGFISVLAKNDDEVCGTGALQAGLKVEGCSGEREAEVYLQPIGSEGPESPRHVVRVEYAVATEALRLDPATRFQPAC